MLPKSKAQRLLRPVCQPTRTAFPQPGNTRPACHPPKITSVRPTSPARVPGGRPVQATTPTSGACLSTTSGTRCGGTTWFHALRPPSRCLRCRAVRLHRSRAPAPALQPGRKILAPAAVIPFGHACFPESGILHPIAAPQSSKLQTPSITRRMACWLYEGILMFGVVFIASPCFDTLSQSRHALANRGLVHGVPVCGLWYLFRGFWSRGQTLATKTWHIRVVSPTGAPVTQARAAAKHG